MRLPPRARTVARGPRGTPGDWVWLLLAAAIFGAQELGITHVGRDGSGAWLRAGIFLVSTGILVGLALHFRRFLGAWLVAAGIAMNFIPMALHGGLMPISYETIEATGAFPEITRADIGDQAANSKDIVLERSDVRAYWLSDRYFVEIPGYGGNIYSAGDFVVFAGLALAALEIVAQAARPGRKPAQAT